MGLDSHLMWSACLTVAHLGRHVHDLVCRPQVVTDSEAAGNSFRASLLRDPRPHQMLNRGSFSETVQHRHGEASHTLRCGVRHMCRMGTGCNIDSHSQLWSARTGWLRKAFLLEPGVSTFSVLTYLSICLHMSERKIHWHSNHRRGQ